MVRNEETASTIFEDETLSTHTHEVSMNLFGTQGSGAEVRICAGFNPEVLQEDSKAAFSSPISGAEKCGELRGESGNVLRRSAGRHQTLALSRHAFDDVATMAFPCIKGRLGSLMSSFTPLRLTSPAPWDPYAHVC
jgi:hypothetical protein